MTEKALVVKEETALVDPWANVELDKVGLRADGVIPFEQWQAVGERLRFMHGAVNSGQARSEDPPKAGVGVLSPFPPIPAPTFAERGFKDGPESNTLRIGGGVETAEAAAPPEVIRGGAEWQPNVTN